MARLAKRLEQVPPCAVCRDTGGLFVASGRGGLGRCGCLRGRLLRAADEARQRRGAEEFEDSGSSRADRALSGVRPQA